MAYAVPAFSGWTEGGEVAVQTHCRRALPPNSLPTQFVALQQGLPLTSSGKVDHGALPAPPAQHRASAPAVEGGYDRTASTDPQVLNRDEVGGGKPAADSTVVELDGHQRRVASVWADTLGVAVECIGPTSNFFLLGGSSGDRDALPPVCVCYCRCHRWPGSHRKRTDGRTATAVRMVTKLAELERAEAEVSNVPRAPVLCALVWVETCRYAPKSERLHSVCVLCDAQRRRQLKSTEGRPKDQAAPSVSRRRYSRHQTGRCRTPVSATVR